MNRDDASTSTSTSILHVRTGTTQAQAQARVPFSCACACVVPVHTWLMLVRMLVLASYVYTSLQGWGIRNTLLSHQVDRVRVQKPTRRSSTHLVCCSLCRVDSLVRATHRQQRYLLGNRFPGRLQSRFGIQRSLPGGSLPPCTKSLLAPRSRCTAGLTGRWHSNWSSF